MKRLISYLMAAGLTATAPEVEAAAPQTEASLEQRVGPKVAIVGDSISAGKPYAPYWKPLQEMCPGMTASNHAVGGQDTRYLLRHFNDVVRGDYDTVIILAGINDVAITDLKDCPNGKDKICTGERWSERQVKKHAEGIIDRLDEMYSRAEEAGMEVVAVTILPWGGYVGAKTKYGQAHYSEHSQQVVDIVNTWIFTRQGITPVSAYQVMENPHNKGHLRPKDTVDKLHPTKEGAQRLAEVIYNTAFKDICSR
ncbi:hypothetical protein COV20_05950 [Candidatus Woesearchaeota archaeon CG10_big_fil_rev_8_21_14_0_10_45_16]|nr:MAG: hypothetical protein COV20_05950 [Candidatus Woesearchaeota archaeon CG10_big_fil_rev_8_21_14_0_10_45_16]